MQRKTIVGLVASSLALMIYSGCSVSHQTKGEERYSIFKGEETSSNCFKKGLKLLKNGEEKYALQIFSEGCEDGNGKCCGEAGIILFRHGNINNAKSMFEKGCNLYDGRSCYNLAKTLEKENNNYGEATKFYKKSCELGYKRGCEK